MPALVCTAPASTSALKISQGQVAGSCRSPAAGGADTAVVEIVSKIKPEVTSSKERAERDISMVVSGLTPKEVVSVPSVSLTGARPGLQILL